MCRWFAYISNTEPCLLEDVLVSPDHALSKQVHDHYLPTLLPHRPRDIDRSPDKLIKMRNVLYNLNGVGIVWYTPTRESFVVGIQGLRPAMYKSITPPLSDFNFKNICANVETTALFAHIRAGSAPVAQPNNHPFVFGRHSFMHNGDVTQFKEIARALSGFVGTEAFKNIGGTTDSETMAALYMTYLAGDDSSAAAWEKEYSVEQMRDALHSTILAVLGTQKRILGAKKYKPSSLNLAVTDGRRLVACRFRNHAVEEPPSLYYSTTAGMSLNRKYKDTETVPLANDGHGKHVIVSSEPSTYEKNQWTLIKRNSCVMVDADCNVVVEKMPYEADLNGEES